MTGKFGQLRCSLGLRIHEKANDSRFPDPSGKTRGQCIASGIRLGRGPDTENVDVVYRHAKPGHGLDQRRHCRIVGPHTTVHVEFAIDLGGAEVGRSPGGGHANFTGGEICIGDNIRVVVGTEEVDGTAARMTSRNDEPTLRVAQFLTVRLGERALQLPKTAFSPARLRPACSIPKPRRCRCPNLCRGLSLKIRSNG